MNQPIGESFMMTADLTTQLYNTIGVPREVGRAVLTCLVASTAETVEDCDKLVETFQRVIEAVRTGLAAGRNFRVDKIDARELFPELGSSAPSQAAYSRSGFPPLPLSGVVIPFPKPKSIN